MERSGQNNEEIGAGARRMDAAASVRPDEMGTCRWRYSVNLYRDLDMLWRIVKGFNWLFAGCVLLVQVIDGFGISLSGVRDAAVAYAVDVAFIAACYYIYAFLQGGRHEWVFAMDERCVRSFRVESGLKRAKATRGLLQFLGAFINVLGLAQRLSRPMREGMQSEFAAVTKVVPDRRRNAIYVCSGRRRNQIFVADEDFDFVLNHIAARCRC